MSEPNSPGFEPASNSVSNPAHFRGVQQALEQEAFNAQGALDTLLASLKQRTLTRDVSQAARDAYNRCYMNVEKAARRVAECRSRGGDETGVQIPAWLAPPVATQAETVRIGAAVDHIGAYKETGGKGPSGRGLPLTGPGSNTDPNWMDTGSNK